MLAVFAAKLGGVILRVPNVFVTSKFKRHSYQQFLLVTFGILSSCHFFEKTIAALPAAVFAQAPSTCKRHFLLHGGVD
ncbi:MAG: hypothetical protein P4L26_04185 [Terracidiphilus sp.]|nr:hypothetical protein [Terracidiphilus sp.]